jgi:uncharacterized protein (TIGR02145 family)
MQLASAYNDTNVSYPSGIPSTTNYIQGICPDGWHLPSGGTTSAASEFVKLDYAVGGNGLNLQSGHSFTYFWKASSNTAVTPADPWKGLLSGFCEHGGSLNYHGSGGDWRSSSEATTNRAYSLNLFDTHFYPSDDNYKVRGFSVRCIKD